MSISARSKAEILDRLRLTESLLVVAAQRSDQLEAQLAEAKRDTTRLTWSFGALDDGASRDQIEHILMHSTSLEEARCLIDGYMQEDPDA